MAEGKKIKSALGFTVMEAVVVMAVMAAVTVTVPAFHAWFKGQGPGLAADRLRVDLQQARIMAVNRRQTCAVVFNAPGPGQYMNTLNQRAVYLEGYRGGVGFLARGPDGRAMAARIAFNRQGMSASAAAQDVFLADIEGRAVYRVRVLGPGGIQVFRWTGGDWR